jgi:hypothetical protein
MGTQCGERYVEGRAWTAEELELGLEVVPVGGIVVVRDGVT